MVYVFVKLCGEQCIYFNKAISHNDIIIHSFFWICGHKSEISRLGNCGFVKLCDEWRTFANTFKYISSQQGQQSQQSQRHIHSFLMAFFWGKAIGVKDFFWVKAEASGGLCPKALKASKTSITSLSRSKKRLTVRWSFSGSMGKKVSSKMS